MQGAIRSAGAATGRLLRAGAALTLLVAVIAGLPWLLVTFIGWPLPDHIPSWDEVIVFLGSPMTDQVILNVLACACWITWAAFTIETAAASVTLVGQLRHHQSPAQDTRWRAPGSRLDPFPGRRRLLGRVAAGLVGAVILAAVPTRHGAGLPVGNQELTGQLILGDGIGPSLTDLRSHAEPAAATHAAMVSAVIAGDPRSAITADTEMRARQVTVRPPRGRAHDSLWRIAERELGDARRWPEIYDLNAGKRQPDGRRLEDPDLIHPGWILELPPAAGSPTADARRQRGPEQPRTGENPPQDQAPAPSATRAPSSSAPASPDHQAAVESSVPTRAAHPTPTGSPAPSATGAPASSAVRAPAATGPTGHPGTVRQPPPAITRPPTEHSPGVDLPTGGYVGIGLAAAVSVLLGLVRIRRRRRDQLTGSGTFRLPIEHPAGEPPPAVVQALRRAHLDTLATDQPPGDATEAPPADEDDLPIPRRLSDPDAWAIGTSTRAAVAPGSPPWVPLGTTPNGRQVGLDLADSGGLGLDGPGALSVARAVIANLLTGTRHGRHAPRARIVLPRIDAERLLGPNVPTPPGIAIVDTASDALDHLLARPGASQPHVLVLTPDNATRERLSRTDFSSTAGVITLRPWPGRANLTVTAEGQVTTRAPSAGSVAAQEPALSDFDGGRAYHLTEAELGGILRLTRDAADRADPDQSRAEDARGKNQSGDMQDSAPEEASQATPPVSGPPVPAPAPAPTPTDPSPGAMRPSPSDAHESPQQPAPPGTAAPEALAEWADAARAGAGRWTPPVIVRVLGPPRLLVNGHPLRHGLRGKTQELLMYLVLHPVGVTSEALTEALWPGQPTTRGALRSVLKRLRNALREATGLSDQAFILYTDGRYRPDRRVIGCDAWQFEAATRRATEASDDAERAGALAEAVALVQGQLLDGADYLWADAYRESVRHHALQVYVRHATALEPHDPEAALAALERALAIDAYNETLYRRVMRLQARLGRPEAVTGTLQLLRRQLADLGQAPDRQTMALAATLQRSESPAATGRS